MVNTFSSTVPHAAAREPPRISDNFPGLISEITVAAKMIEAKIRNAGLWNRWYC